jgi:hypothetical protein
MADKSTGYIRDVMNKITELKDNDATIKKIKSSKKKPEHYDEYLKLYQDSYKEFSNKKKDYIESLDEFDKIGETIEKFNWDKIEVYAGKLESVFDESQEILNQCQGHINSSDELLNSLISKVKDYIYNEFEKKNLQIPKWYIGNIIFEKKLTSVDVADELYKCKAQEFNNQKKDILDKVNVEANKIVNVKNDIAKDLGILKPSSIARNVVQISTKSPIVVLAKLHEALLDENGKFPKFGTKDLLNMGTKTLDKKVKNSMAKVINCKWGKFEELNKMLDFYKDIEKNLNALDNGAIKISESVQRHSKELEQKESVDDLLKMSTESKLEIRKQIQLNEKHNQTITLYLKALSYREQCKVILIAIATLEMTLQRLNERDGKKLEHYFHYEGVDKAKIFKLCFAVFKFAISLIPIIGQCIGTFAESLVEFMEDVKDTIDDAIDVFENGKEVIETAKE